MHVILTACLLAAGMSGCIGGNSGPPPPIDDPDGAGAQSQTWTMQASLDALQKLEGQVQVVSGVRNLVLAVAEEEYEPSLNLTPRGDAVYNWKHWYFDPNATPPHPSTKLLGRLQGHMVADSGEHLFNIGNDPIAVPEMMQYWEDNRVGEFLIDSDEAAVIAFELGGKAASIGRDLVKIHYRLHAVAGEPHWDVVYREEGLPFFAVSLDAMLGTVVKMSTALPEIEMADAMSLADADAWASDAVLVQVQGNEGMWTGFVSPPILIGSIGVLPSGAEMVPGDNRSTSWLLSYYSASLETARTYVTLGDQLLFAHDWSLNSARLLSVQLEADDWTNMTRSYSDVGEALVALFGTNQTNFTHGLRYNLNSRPIPDTDPVEWTPVWGIVQQPGRVDDMIMPSFAVDAYNQTVIYRPHGQ